MKPNMSKDKIKRQDGILTEEKLNEIYEQMRYCSECGKESDIKIDFMCYECYESKFSNYPQPNKRGE